MSRFKESKLSGLCLAVVFLSIWIPMSECAKKPVGVARKEDIPYIKCQVCEKLAHQLHQQVQAKQVEISPKKLVEQDSEGLCDSECKTIERACQEVMGYSDTDVAEYMYTNKPDVDSLINFLCKDLTKACRVKPPPVPKDRTPGEPFVPKPSKDAEMDKILRSMEGMPGAPNMKMYSRDELMNMQNFGNEDADDDDDDEESDFPSNLGKVLRGKETKKTDWKERITKGIQDAGVTVKIHANRISHRLRKWWTGKKAGLKRSPKPSKAEL